MLNFFRDLGTVGAGGHPGAGRALGLREERVVPLPLPLRRAAGTRRAAEPDAHPPRRPTRASTARSARRRARRCCRSIDSLSVKSAECTGCLECVAVCPVKGALDLAVARRRRVPLAVTACGIAMIFLALVGLARVTGHWHTSAARRHRIAR